MNEYEWKKENIFFQSNLPLPSQHTNFFLFVVGQWASLPRPVVGSCGMRGGLKQVSELKN